MLTWLIWLQPPHPSHSPKMFARLLSTASFHRLVPSISFYFFKFFIHLCEVDFIQEMFNILSLLRTSWRRRACSCIISIDRGRNMIVLNDLTLTSLPCKPVYKELNYRSIDLHDKKLQPKFKNLFDIRNADQKLLARLLLPINALNFSYFV